MSGPRAPLMRLTTLWQRESRAGRMYFSGFLGNCQLLMFQGDDIVRDNGEVVTTWNLMLQEKDQPPRQAHPQILPPTRGQRTHERSRDAAQRMQEPPQGWLDDSEAAIRDLEGRGR